MLYTLTLYSAVCPLYLNKTGKKKKETMEWTKNILTHLILIFMVHLVSISLSFHISESFPAFLTKLL